MNREEARKAAEVMLAHADGKEIECRILDGGWVTKTHQSFNWQEYEYRVKPEPREFWVKLDPRDVIHTSKVLDPANAERNGWIRVREVLE